MLKQHCETSRVELSKYNGATRSWKCSNSGGWRFLYDSSRLGSKSEYEKRGLKFLNRKRETYVLRVGT